MLRDVNIAYFQKKIGAHFSISARTNRSGVAQIFQRTYDVEIVGPHADSNTLYAWVRSLDRDKNHIVVTGSRKDHGVKSTPLPDDAHVDEIIKSLLRTLDGEFFEAYADSIVLEYLPDRGAGHR